LIPEKMTRKKQRINRVTTRGGDRGETSLADGSRVAKSDPRIHAIGAVDELNSFVGMLVVGLRKSEDHADFLSQLAVLQQELFDLGAHLATVGATPVPEPDWLDEAVQTINAELPPLTEFVIPNGGEASVLCHVCRTVCRRAERHCWEVVECEDAARYLNRLSDLLFVMSRALNQTAPGEESQWRGLS
jgi:cob(I)alamin adenosyltransferase